MRIGIFGGTFNPIHNGHTHIAREVSSIIEIEKMILMVAYMPPHKEVVGGVTAEDRVAMARLAVSGDPLLEVSTLEVDKKGTSFSVATIRALRESYGRNAQLYFIVGADAVKDLHTWKRIDEIFELSEFVIVNRPGFSTEGAPERARIVEVTPQAISSSEIRRRTAEGSSIKGLVHPDVEAYIIRKSLYR